ncbi:hypothetical protein [Nesterenkonia ebinurensis]|uniref:hypothetical protein n=1 Tax=Nesterenkonia ebinurensis TaxID=2608252 RepID=UPI00168A73A3|nr:hypothetical protein [Nesterenkonia ebinurensis]
MASPTVNYQCPEEEKTYSNSTSPYEQLNIPAGTKGHLPLSERSGVLTQAAV